MASGCQKEGEIVRYSVPKTRSDPSPHPVVDQARDQQASTSERRGERMLAAIIARNGTTWFFKLIGPGESIGKQNAPFKNLIESVQFADGGANPKWKLPTGWRQQPGSGMRYATIEISTSQQPLELTVTPLKTGEGDFGDYVLANVDRWRQQLGLPPTSKDELFGKNGQAGQITEVKCEDGKDGLIVDLVGDSAPGSAGGLAGSSPPLPIGHGSADFGKSQAGNSPSLTYQSPTGWIPAKLTACVKSHSRSATVPARPRSP